MATNTPVNFYRGNPAYGATNVNRAITTAALTSNLVTVTFNSNHGLTQVGTLLSVQGVGASYDGLFPVNSFPALNTATYVVTASNISSASVTPNGSGILNSGVTVGQTISNSGTFNYVVPEVPRVMQNVVYGNHFKVVVTVCPIRETIVVDTHPQPCVSDSSDAEFSIMPRNVNDTVYAPTVKTGVVSYGSGDNNGPGVFVANGTIVTTGNSQIVSEYIKYGTTPGSGTTGATASVVMGGDFTALFPGSCTQPLYYEAYAVNAAGFTGHGEEVYGSNVRCNNVATTTVATWTTGTVTSVSNCGSFTLQSDGVAVGNSIHAGAIYTVHAPCDTRPGSYNKTKWPYDVSVGDRVSVFGVITDTTISAQDIHNGNVEIIRQRFI